MKLEKTLTALLAALSLFTLILAPGCGTSEKSGGDEDFSDAEEQAEAETADKPLYSSTGKFIKNAAGQTIILRGINVAHNFLKDVEDEKAGAAAAAFLDVSASGFNAVRLPTEWASIEPELDKYNQEYIDLVVKHVKLAADAGLYVIVDMHQDFFGVGFDGDGAPKYACDSKFYETYQSADPAFLRYFTDEVTACFDAFWRSDYLQDRQHKAALKIAEKIKDNPLVMGFDCINEPFPGTTRGEEFDVEYMAPFHQKFASALSPEIPGRLFFYEPSLLISANLQCWMPGPQGAYEGVFVPHYYNTSIEMNTNYDGNDQSVIDTVAAFDEMAAAMGTPWAFGEMGGKTKTPNLDKFLFVLYKAMDERMAGTFIWMYSKSDGDFGFLEKSTGKWHPHAKAILRPTPSVVSGDLLNFSWDYDSLTFKMEWNEDKSLGVESRVIVPKWLKEAGFTLKIDGAQAEPVYNAQGDRLIIALGAGGRRALELVAKSAFPY